MNFLSHIFGKYLLLSLITHPSDDYCYSTDKEKAQQKHYSLQTKHAKYSTVLESAVPGKNSFSADIMAHCKPKQIWLVMRHGTRYPSAGTAKHFAILSNVQKQIKPDNLCSDDYKLLKNWKYDANSTNTPCDLTKPQGWNDLRELAASYQAMFPSLFNPIYTPETYTFGHSSAQRAKSSCQAFTEGLFGSGMMQWYSAIHFITNNILLRPWYECPEFSRICEALDDPNSEVNKFSRSEPFSDALHNTTRRLGITKSLTPEEIRAMWSECRYEQSYNLKKSSPWCAAFTLDVAKVLEYDDDLDFYYKLSYGDGYLTRKLPCDTIRNLLENMETEHPSNKVTAYFSHAELILMILTALGTEYDKKTLLADDYSEEKHRKFFTSRLVPYAASFAAVRYECDNEYGNKAETRVQFLLNQKPIEMHWCKERSVCDVNEIRRYYKNSTMAHCPHGICGPDFGQKLNLKNYEGSKNTC